MFFSVLPEFLGKDNAFLITFYDLWKYPFQIILIIRSMELEFTIARVELGIFPSQNHCITRFPGRKNT